MTESQRNSIVEAHLPMVLDIARAMKADLPRTLDFEDLAQAGAVALIEVAGSGRYDPLRGPFAAFAYKRVRGAMANWVDSQYPNRAHVEVSPDVPDRSIPIDRAFLARERVQRTRRAVAGLPPAERKVIEFGYRDGKTQRQIGDETGVSQVRVCEIHRSALRRLKRVMIVAAA